MSKKILSIIGSLACVAVCCTVGCSKKKPQVPTSDGSSVPAAAQAPGQPETAATVTPEIVSRGIQDAQSAMAAKNFEKATAEMLEVQKTLSTLPPQQSGPAAFEMRQLQQNLATAAAAGDPNAIAAMQRLSANRHR